MSEPRTEAGKRLQTRLAYDRDPASYLPGDFYPEDRAAILAIEAEAASLDGLREALVDLVEFTEARVKDTCTPLSGCALANAKRLLALRDEGDTP